MYNVFWAEDGSVYKRGITRNMEYLHSWALLVQLQTTPVSWDKAISVGMLYFIFVDVRTLTSERKNRTSKASDGYPVFLKSGRCKAEATVRRKKGKRG